MSRNRRPGDYEVGYGKPPREHQFKPGHSGHRRVETAPYRDVEQARLEKLNELVTVTIGGKKVTMTCQEYLLEKQWQEGAKGDGPAARFMLRTPKPGRPSYPQKPSWELNPPNGSRQVTFEVTDEQLAMIDQIQEELGQYYVPAPTSAPPGKRRAEKLREDDD